MPEQWADKHSEMFGKSSQKESEREDKLFFSLSSAVLEKTITTNSMEDATELYC